MKFTDNLPIYVQISNLIKKRIVSGELNPEDKLPSVRDLSTEVKANPNTIQRAYSELENDNLVFTQRGMGTFVTKDNKIIIKLKEEMAKNIINNCVIEMQAIGFSKEDIQNKINKKLKED